MYGNQRPPVGGRIGEQLEGLKAEFDVLAHDVGVYKMQRDDYERKLQQQLTELSSIQTALFDLERRCMKAKEGDGERRDVLESPSLPGPSLQQQFPPLAMRDGKRMGFQPSLPLKRSRPDDGPKLAPGPAPMQPAFGRGLPPLQSMDASRMDASRMDRQKEMQRQERKEEMHHRAQQPLSIAPKPVPTHAHSSAISNVVSRQPDPEGQPWRAVYNPNVQTSLEVGLAHQLEHDSVVCCVRFSNDGQYLATGSNRKAQIFSVADGSLAHSFVDPGRNEDLYLRSVCFSPDNKYLACGAEDHTVKLWDIGNDAIVHTFEGHTLDIYSLDFSSDGRFIVSGSGDKKAKVWDVEKRKCVFTLGNDEVGPKDGVTSVAISPDGRLVAAGSLDNVVRLWDAHTGYFLERYEGHTDSVYSVAFSPDGKSLASGSLDKTLKLWDLSESRSRSRCRSTFTGHSDYVLSVAFSPDGNWLVSGSKDSSVQFWDPRNAVTHMKLEGHKNSVISVAVNPASGTFATGSGDLQAKIWSYKAATPSG